MKVNTAAIAMIRNISEKRDKIDKIVSRIKFQQARQSLPLDDSFS